MTDGEALLATIIAEPWNDLPRLVYADWLDENGREIEAKHIRDEVAHPTTSTPHYVFPGTVPILAYRRGFVAEIRCTMAYWLSNGPEWVRDAPIERVAITEPLYVMPPEIARWANHIGGVTRRDVDETSRACIAWARSVQ